MNTILLCVGIAVVVIAFIGALEEGLAGLLTGGLLGVLVGGVLGLLVAVIISGFNMETVKTRGDLSTMGDGLGSSGRFALGYGTVESKPVFMYYAKGENDTYTLQHAGAEISTVVQDGGMYYEVESERPKDNGWTLPMEPVVTHITFHVPKDSITNNVVLDAQ